jgi:hypothetical protein
LATFGSIPHKTVKVYSYKAVSLKKELTFSIAEHRGSGAVVEHSVSKHGHSALVVEHSISEREHSVLEFEHSTTVVEHSSSKSAPIIYNF